MTLVFVIALVALAFLQGVGIYLSQRRRTVAIESLIAAMNDINEYLTARKNNQRGEKQ